MIKNSYLLIENSYVLVELPISIPSNAQLQSWWTVWRLRLVLLPSSGHLSKCRETCFRWTPWNYTTQVWGSGSEFWRLEEPEKFSDLISSSLQHKHHVSITYSLEITDIKFNSGISWLFDLVNYPKLIFCNFFTYMV